MSLAVPQSPSQGLVVLWLFQHLLHRLYHAFCFPITLWDLWATGDVLKLVGTGELGEFLQ